jgi:hypothetical protein
MKFVSKLTAPIRGYFAAGQSKASKIWRMVMALITLALVTYSFMQPQTTLVAAGAFALYTLCRCVMAKNSLGRTVLFTLLVFVLYLAFYTLVALYVMPFLHVLTYYTWKWFMPTITVLLVGVLLNRLLALLKIKSKKAENTQASLETSRRTRLQLAVSALALLLAFCTLFTNHVPMFVTWQKRWSVRPEVLAEIPDTVNNRILLRDNAREFIQNASKDNTLRVLEPHVVKLPNSNTLYWQSSLQLDTRYGRILGTTSQVIHTDADKVKMHVDTLDGEKAFFLCGENSWVVNAAFNVRHPFSKMGEASCYRKENGEWVTLIPYIGTMPSKWGTMIPGLYGVLEISKFCWVTDHSPEDAVKQFPGVFFMPDETVRELSEAYCAWHDGIKSIATEKGYLEISEEPNAEETGNRLPYIQEFKDIGLQAYLPLEPQGPNYALVEVLFFDAIGKPRVYVVPEHAHLNAPRKALENTYKCDPGVSWTNRRTREVRLVKGPGGTFWMPGVTLHDPDHPESQAYVMTALVDAVTLDAYRLSNEHELEEVNRFAAEGAHGAKK